MLKARTLSAITIFISAFLLFSVEPLIAKKILPWFGGSASVWSICLVFFQLVLLAGYLYPRLLSRHLDFRKQAVVHVLLLLASLFALPLGPSTKWKPSPGDDPTWRLAVILIVSVGLPFFVLSSTSPLLQDWLARGGHKAPHRLFALSNLSSLAALLLYPVLIEPRFNLSGQSMAWSVGYVLFVFLCATCAWVSRGVEGSKREEPLPRQHIGLGVQFTWFALACCGSILLLAVTNHLSENVASVPLLWVLPLATYLLTFVLSFNFYHFYKRALFLRLLALGLGLIAYGIYDIRAVEILQVTLPVFLFGLFACCMFCHGELNRLRPEARSLTTFYLILSFGSASGAVFVGLIAPRIFAAVYELPLALVLTAVLALASNWRSGWASRALWLAMTASTILVFGSNVSAYRKDSLSMRRSFYGSLRVVQSPRAGPQQTRTLFHGTITHGAQFVWPPMRYRPTTYYGPDSGIGILLRECFAAPKHVGIIGLGVGTLSAYGKSGDVFRFYEINPQVVELAQSLFTYLRETKAEIQIVSGDARLSLEQDHSPPFDVLVIDAFSGDAIPVHLLTVEAIRIYLNHLSPGGVMAFHVSNQYLDLSPVVEQLARNIHYNSVLIRNHGDEDNLVMPSDWVLVTRNQRVLNNASLAVHRIPIPRRELRLWTDNFNNLFQILKTPRLFEN